MQKTKPKVIELSSKADKVNLPIVNPVQQIIKENQDGAKRTAQKKTRAMQEVKMVTQMEKRLMGIFNPRLLFPDFEDDGNEELFQNYQEKMKRDFLVCLLGIIFAITFVMGILQFTQTVQHALKGTLLNVLAAVFVLLIVFVHLQHRFQEELQQALLLIILLTLCLPIICQQVMQKKSESFSTETVSLSVLFIFLLYRLLLMKIFHAIAAGLLISTVHLMMALIRADHLHLIAADFVVLVAINFLGLFASSMSERNLRYGFLQTRNTVATGLVMQKENIQQERLLLSVLPRHVAMEMKVDIEGEARSKSSRQFSKVYIQRHKHVSRY